MINNQTGQKMRTLSFTVALTQAIGPRTCQVTETQVKKLFILSTYDKCYMHYVSFLVVNSKFYFTGDVTMQ